MPSLPQIDFVGRRVSRLVCGGNPQSGFSHVSAALDREMVEYYTMPNQMALLDACWAQGVNTFQSRGDRHQMRTYLEHRLGGGQMQWIAQTASEFSSLEANVREIARYEPIAIYHHGTHTDNSWYLGQLDSVRDVVKMIHDCGLPAGVASHIPEVIETIEEQGWETDFYMTCFYNLARQYKSAPAVDQDAYRRDSYPMTDPPRMTAIVRQLTKPCIGFKIMAASRNCGSPRDTRAAFEYALSAIKPTDVVCVGMFQKHGHQVAENARFVREILNTA